VNSKVATETSGKGAQKKIRHREFAKRMEQACETHPLCPPMHHGRLGWIAEQLEKKFGRKTTIESIRRWISGEARPRLETLNELAELFGVDSAWLALGTTPDFDPKDRKVRKAEVSGSVGLLASVIQMSGGHPAFPDDGDDKSSVDLYAVIRGAHYRFKVMLGTSDADGRLSFTVPADLDGTIAIGVQQLDNFSYAFYEIEDEVIALGDRKGGYSVLTVTPDQLRRIETFSERL
jgi:transcriptional regulator with XRE-family HTH domain